ncbi:GntR family transcriptional regulator [Rothia sp. AR01]|uniref:GntR family transcriptional regulator n=1 Tax=Rothia santali TaxID=2949643 RepID=A0A9X2HK31_9MICC|nr:GntR family transcriptional regulator [Rothia santali]MCP3426348.1 GntR family transcriptional regulator [Rothia santali]
MTPPRPVSSQRRAYEHIRSEVLVDPSTQGTFLNEQRLAETIGVSRTPVREALRVLDSEGLVELIPNRGAYVPVITAAQAHDVMELREILECHAASVALGSAGEVAAAMREVLARQQELAGVGAAGSQLEFIALDRDFHFALLRASGNREIIQTYDRLQTRQRIIGAQALSALSRRREVCREHLAIVEALEAGDLDAAHRAIREHLRITEGVLMRDVRA